jgi:hypothetical protein
MGATLPMRKPLTRASTSANVKIDLRRWMLMV